MPHSTPNFGFDRVCRFLLLLAQLVLIAAIVYLFNIEVRRHFFPVLCLIIGGFAIHFWLPIQFRLLFFAILSMASVLFLLGMETGSWVLGIGICLVGICYLPFLLTTRMALLVASGAVLASLRASSPRPFWPVVGSMFMFRLVTFVHQLRRDKKVPPLASALAYFFMLPNACFPLFPVVDYKTFRETRYNEDEWDIYQRGVIWIVRGLVHLLFYRYVKANLVPEAYQLYDITYIALFVVTNYALYLQVSGQFHLITGLLHLFGFNLPRTHHWFFLASSCSDIWRRINIYWKDFMTKYFFYPMFYALRYRGASLNVAMVASVFFVFLSTWILHSWQTFWLLGRFPLTLNDACLWLGAGFFVAINAMIESRRRSLVDRSPLWVAFTLSAQTVAMFVLVGIFWACWTKPGFLNLVIGSLTRPESIAGLLRVLIWVVAAIAVGTGAVLLLKRAAPAPLSPPIDFYSSAKLQLTALVVVFVFLLPRSEVMFTTNFAKVISAFRADPTIAADAGEKLQSYYEDLNSAKIQAGPLISGFFPAEGRGRPEALGFYKISRQADIYQVTELIPGLETELEGSRFSVNEFGMRDRKSITFEKQSGTIRIAFVGSSVVLGYGVSDDEVFARRFESRLNEQFGNSSRRFEVLNFGVGKQWPTHRMTRVQRKVMAFQPDALYYFAHQDEFKDIATQPSQLIANQLELPSKYFRELADRVGVNSTMAPGAIQGLLSFHETELLTAVYKTIVDECRREATVPVWIYLPMPGSSAQDVGPQLFPLAKAAGFTVGDLSDWTHGQIDLMRDEAGYHPNVRGHEMITEALMNMVKTFPETLPLE